MENIKIYDNGKEVPHEDVLKNALNRAYFTLAKYRNLLGPQGLFDLFRDEAKKTDAQYLEAYKNSRPGEYKYATLEFHVKNCSTEDFLRSFVTYPVVKGRECHPEHFVALHPDGGTGAMEVLETVGDGDTVFRFKVISATDPEVFPFKPEPDCTFCMRSSLTTTDGQPVGVYIFHQFTDVGNDLIAKPCIVFPEGTDDAVVEGQKNHIAVEYMNWLSFAAESRNQAQG